MRVVTLYGEIAGDKIVDVEHLSLELQSGERPRRSFQLLLQRRYVIVVDVRVSKRVDEFARL